MSGKKISNDNIITDNVIMDLKPLSFHTISDKDIVDFIHLQCQKVLELAQKKNDSCEVAQAINLNTFDVLNPVFGDAHSVDIDFLVSQMKGTDYAFLVMHNHPSGLHFSIRDIDPDLDVPEDIKEKYLLLKSKLQSNSSVPK